MARGLGNEGLYNSCCGNKGADQLRGYREADLRFCFRICKKPVFSRRASNDDVESITILYEIPRGNRPVRDKAATMTIDDFYRNVTIYCDLCGCNFQYLNCDLNLVFAQT